MHFFVKGLSSQTYSVDVCPDNDINSLKALIEEQTGVPSSQQRLVFAGHHLNDGSTIDESGIRTDNTVWLLLRLKGGMEVVTIFVNVLGGKSVTIEIPSNSSIAQVQSKLGEVACLDSSKFELVFQGQRLEPNKTLSSYHIGASSTLEAVLPHIPKGRCSSIGCLEKVSKIIGECRYCGNGYCGKHRLPESHACDNIQGCKQQSFEKNSNKLMGEKCVADKV